MSTSCLHASAATEGDDGGFDIVCSLVRLLLVCAMKTHDRCPGFSVHPLLAIPRLKRDFGAFTPSFRHTKLGTGSKIVPPRRLFKSKMYCTVHCVQAIAPPKFMVLRVGICLWRTTYIASGLTACLRGIQGCLNLKDLNAKSI